MKKSQLVSIITTLALALCMAFMPALCACSNSTGQDAVQAQAGDDGSSVEAEGGQDNAGSVALNMEDNSPSSDPDSADDPEDAISAGQDEDDADAVTSAPSDSEDASDSGEVVSSSTDDGQDDAAATSPESDGKEDASQTTSSSGASKLKVTEDGWYTSKEEVALYIHTYGHLPGNFISKTKARAAGWVAKEGNLDEACPGMSIGGSVYYNEGWDGEELLPEARGRTWKECDINYHGGYRGAERLVFSNDGLIFYTDDHYQTFEQLY